MFTSYRHFAPQQAFYTMSHVGFVFFPKKVSVHTVRCLGFLSNTVPMIYKYIFSKKKKNLLILHSLLHYIYIYIWQNVMKECFSLKSSFLLFFWREGNSGCLNPGACQTKDCCSIYEPPCLFGKLGYIVLLASMRHFNPLMYFFLHFYGAWEEDHVLHH